MITSPVRWHPEERAETSGRDGDEALREHLNWFSMLRAWQIVLKLLTTQNLFRAQQMTNPHSSSGDIGSPQKYIILQPLQ